MKSGQIFPSWFLMTTYITGSMVIIPFFLWEFNIFRHDSLLYIFALGFLGWGGKSVWLLITFLRKRKQGVRL